MTTLRPYSVRVFVPSGQPDDLIVIEKSNWTGLGFAFPRSSISAVKSRSEMQQAGVYVLWGQEEDESLPKVYVGMSDAVGNRISNHIGNAEREFWEHTAAFTSKDGNFTGTHARYVESHLISLAGQAGRCVLQNSQDPNTPSMSEADKADADSFLQDVLLCLPLLGANFFSELRIRQVRQQVADAVQPAEPTQSSPLMDDAGMFYLRSGDGDRAVDATGYVSGSEFVVLAGSKAAKSEIPSVHPSITKRRSDLIRRGILVDEGSFYSLTRDTPFDRPSTASSTMRGSNSNGRIEWKDAGGKSLRDVEKDSVLERP